MTEDAIHSMGNGKMLLYGQGSDIKHVFGPPYTSCDQLSISVQADMAWNTRRKKGTLVWEHTGFANGKEVAVLTDVMHPMMPIWARKIEIFNFEMILNCIYPMSSVAFDEKDDNQSDRKIWFRRFRIPEGTPLFSFFPHYYLSSDPAFYLIYAEGNVSVQTGELSRIRVHSGISEIRIIGGPTFPENREFEECSKTLPFEHLIEESLKISKKLFSRINIGISEDTPIELADEVRGVAEDVAVLITTQQCQDGGVIAGYPFQMAYVRDQYGVSRGLLAMGLADEAERMLDFRFNKWKRFGNLRNAEMAGGDSIRHRHENDDVELTAYTILQAFDFAEATGLKEKLLEWFPMLAWCFETQLTHLHRGMLPFNGDETYVAGGFILRHQLNDGSTEATLLFYESGMKLLEFGEAFRLWDKRKIQAYRSILHNTRKKYMENFAIDGKLITNNPRRVDDSLALPRYRHGVCMACMETSDTWFGWTEQIESNFYVCPRCRNNVARKLLKSEPVIIPSVALFPPFIKSTIISNKFLYQQAESILAEFKAVMESNGSTSNKRFVGYDMGLMLYFMSVVKHLETNDFMRFVLDSRDAVSSWSERYLGKKHDGCMCRPWESAINLSAVLNCLK